MFRNPLEERGGRVCNARNTFFLKKSSLRALRAHNVRTFPGGLQRPCPTIPLRSGLRFGRCHGWSMR